MGWGLAYERDGVVLCEDGDEWCDGLWVGWVVWHVYGLGSSPLLPPPPTAWQDLYEL